MCGVFSLISKHENRPSNDLIDLILNDLEKRGPDNSSVNFFKNLVFGHTRLSLVGLGEENDQPIHDTDFNFILSFNGEVYNWIELAKKYKIENCTGDAQLLFILLSRYSFEKIINEIDGPFGLVFFSKEKESIYLARDRFGEKPLYYKDSKDFIMISSSNKYLQNNKDLKSSDFKEYFKTSDTEGFYIPNGVESVQPGSCLVIKDCLTNPVLEKIKFSKSQIKNNISDLFDLLVKSAEIRARMDVDFSILLSGGVDSAITTAILCDLGYRPKCFTVANSPFDSEYIGAKRIADRFGLDLKRIQLNKNLKDYYSFYESQFSPISDLAGFPLYCATKYIKKYFKCSFVGDGADEAFMGYPRYIVAHLIDVLGFNAVKKILFFSNNYNFNKNKLSKVSNKLELLSILLSRNKSELNLFQNKYFSFEDSAVKIMQSFDQNNRLPNYLMLKSDNFSMANSVELRSIFLQNEIFEYSNNLDFKDNWNFFFQNKKLLRKILKENYQIKINYKKSGFFVDHLTNLKKFLNIILYSAEKFPTQKNFLADLINENFKLNLTNINSLLSVIFFSSNEDFKQEVLKNISN